MTAQSGSSPVVRVCLGLRGASQKQINVALSFGIWPKLTACSAQLSLQHFGFNFRPNSWICTWAVEAISYFSYSRPLWTRDSQDMNRKEQCLLLICSALSWSSEAWPAAASHSALLSVRVKCDIYCNFFTPRYRILLTYASLVLLFLNHVEFACKQSW